MTFFSRVAGRKLKVKKQLGPPLLPASMQSFIANRLTDAAGIGFMTAGVCLAGALYTFNIADPSFNTVSTGAKIHNIFGAIGSYTADLLLQTLGLAAYLFAAAFIAWGGRILLRRPL